MIVTFTLIHWIAGIEFVSVGALSVLRYLLYLIFCFTASKNYIDFKYIFKIYKVISLIFAIYVFLQFIAYYLFHTILPINVLSIFGFKTFDSVYWYDNISRYAGNVVMYRPCSVFVEPAHYVVYQAPILYILTNDIVDTNKRNFKYSLIILASILLSGSTTGIVIIAFCLIRRIINLFRKNFVKMIAFSILILIFSVFFFNSTYGSRIVERTFSDASNGAINGRFSNAESVFSLSNHHMYIGNGMSYESDSYVPTFPRLFLSFGYIGTFIFIIMLLITYLKCNFIGRRILILFIITMVGTLSLFGISVVLYMSLIYSNYYRNKENENVSLERC